MSHQPRPPPTVEIRNDPPTVENDPTEGIRGVQWKLVLDPHGGNMYQGGKLTESYSGKDD